jgi:hypothetical protein
VEPIALAHGETSRDRMVELLVAPPHRSAIIDFR